MKIAIIGGGFSGTSLSAQLILNGSSPLSVTMVEKTDRVGKGVAYSTPFPWHLLNVRAGQMGALEEDPRGFYNWLKEYESSWRNADPAFECLSFNKEDFLPRKLFGLYLSDLLKQIKQKALEHDKTFEIIQKEVTDLELNSKKNLNIIFSDHQVLETDIVVLANGIQTTKVLPFDIKSDRYITNIWNCDKNLLAQQISQTNSESNILIVGTGLTMVDMVTTLDKLGYQGKIIALSIHGHLPCSHTAKEQPTLSMSNEIFEPDSLLDKLVVFRQELLSIEEKEANWRQLIDGLRPHSIGLWQQLSLADKKCFLRHLTSLWNKHRHRIPLESEQLLDNLIKKKRLEIIAGKVIRLEEAEKNHLDVHYHLRESKDKKMIKVDYMYNCTGPEYSLEKHPQPLIKNLMKRGWIQKDALGLGIKSNSCFQAEGPMAEKIYVMGALLFGERFETNTIREIRQQSKIIANLLKKWSKDPIHS